MVSFDWQSVNQPINSKLYIKLYALTYTIEGFPTTLLYVTFFGEFFVLLKIDSFIIKLEKCL